MAAEAPEFLVAQSTSPQLPPSPENEEARLETMKVLGISGEKFTPDPMLNSMCKTISKLMDVPIAGISMVQDKKLHMRAVAGLPGDFSCARDGAFCSWTLLPRKPEILVVEDTLKDHRFSSLDHVKGPNGLRFYAGAPLVASNGVRLGAVCVFDKKPRKMKAEEYNLLSNFSEIAMRRLEEREFKKIKAIGTDELTRSEIDLLQPIVLCDVSGGRWWSLLYCNDTFSKVTGVVVEGDVNAESNFWKLFRPANPDAKAKIQEEVETDIKNGKDFSVMVRRRESSNKHTFEMHFRPATKANLGGHAGAISVPSLVAAAEIGESSNTYYFATVKPADDLTTEQVSREGKAKAGKVMQQTFMSQAYLSKQPASPSPTGDEGMQDVTMGVLCSNTANGLVYRARWKKRSVSVKVVEVKQSECVQGLQFGEAQVPLEAALCLDFDHPNVISTYKVVIEDSPGGQTGPSEKLLLTWMVREWCGRGTLSDALHRGWLRLPSGKPNVAAVLAAAHEVASAVLYLHGKDVIHGDLCPDSVLLTDDKGYTASKYKDFIAKVSEFGVSIKSETPVTTTKPGTASHAAPELLSKAQMSKATDTYAFGMLLWEIYMGQAVWPTLNFSQLQRRVVAAMEKPPLPSDTPTGIKELIADCLANLPEDRPTFKVLTDRIRRLAQEEAAGQLVYTLAAPAEKKSSKLFRMDSKKDREEQRKLVPAMPSQDMANISLKCPAPKGPEVIKAREPKKSLFKRMIPSLKS